MDDAKPITARFRLPRVARGTCAAALLLLSACGDDAPTGEPPTPADEQAAPEAPPLPTTAEPEAEAKAAPAGTAPADPDDACGQMILSTYKGAKFAEDDVTRTPAEAQKRAEVLHGRVTGGEDFDALAKQHSEAPSSAPRGGVMGTYRRADWPAIHAALKEPLFALQVGEVADKVVEAPYGYVVLKRCPVERAHARHILIRYANAKRAPDEVSRKRWEARGLAEKLLRKLGSGEDFAELAREYSEDGSAERGGDIGTPGRGQLAVAFEQALFALPEGGRSRVVESEYGFHIIERLPDN